MTLLLYNPLADTPMIRVTLIAGTYEPTRCGVAHYTDRLRHALHHRGIQSTVLTIHAAAQAAQQADIIGAVRDWSLLELWSLARSVCTTPTDLLHIQHAAGTYSFERAIFLLPLLLKVMGWRKPIVTTVHEYGWWEWQPAWIPSPLMEWLKQWGQHRGWWDREDGFLLTHSDAIITANSQAEAVIRKRLSAFNDSQHDPSHQRLYAIGIAPNIEVAPVDQTSARQLVRQACHWTDDTTVITFFGFLHPVKGLETLLEAFKQVVTVNPQARLLLLGGVESLALVGEHASNYWHKLHAVVSELELEEFVHLTGYLSAETASQYLSGVDIGVLPFNHGVTLKSGSLLALLAHGLPVVATCSTVQDDALTDDRLLQLIPPREVDQLAIALIELLSNPSRCHQLRDTGRKFTQALGWNAIADAHVQVYQSVLQCQAVH